MSTTLSPIEVTTRYASTVADLPAAWAFIMERVDSAGPNPRITISPIFTIHEDGVDYDPPPRHFEVVVEGMQHEDERA